MDTTTPTGHVIHVMPSEAVAPVIIMLVHQIQNAPPPREEPTMPPMVALALAALIQDVDIPATVPVVVEEEDTTPPIIEDHDIPI